MRVGENSTLNTVRDSLNRSRMRMADLQKQNATMKRVNNPSDDPVGNVKLMTIKGESLDNTQFERNSNLAKTFLNYTDTSLEEVTDLIVRAKELALGQASSAANGADSRVMVAEEIKNIQAQMGSISNRKLGDRYIFAGYRTSTQPFDENGQYHGDEGKIMVEVQKDVFVGMNIPGKDIFQGTGKPKNINQGINPGANSLPGRSPAADGLAGTSSGGPESIVPGGRNPQEDIFSALDALRVGLMTNDVDMIRSTIEPLDSIRDRVITMRAQVGARSNGIDNAIANMGKKNVFNAELQSSIEDADIIQVVSDMAREETVLKASLQASNKLIQPTLLEFLR
ncbi:MAG: flagellar hook-associated protein 3 [Proteobacteria bacterium]|nr:MAG: flagellar hook-associated protein 3 [Pseudomonadota bacterium]